MYSIKRFAKPCKSVPKPPLLSSRLLAQVRERLRYLHYSLRTEKVYVYWVRFFVRWSGMRHSRDMGATDVQAFLSMLANERRGSASTYHQKTAPVMGRCHRIGAAYPDLPLLRR